MTLVQRNFTAERPNQLWLTYIIEHHTSEEKLYLCAIKDVFINRIVGYSMDSRINVQLAVNAVEMAVAHRGHPCGVTVHSDRGSQFRSRKFTQALERQGLVGSMGRVGAAGDNAAMESFFNMLQKNVLDRRWWSSRQELRLAIVGYLEGRYNRKSRRRGFGENDREPVRGYNVRVCRSGRINLRVNQTLSRPRSRAIPQPAKPLVVSTLVTWKRMNGHTSCPIRG